MTASRRARPSSGRCARGTAAEDLYSQLTIVHPVMHRTDLPGVSKFPVDDWVKQGQLAGPSGAIRIGRAV